MIKYIYICKMQIATKICESFNAEICNHKKDQKQIKAQ